MNWPDAEPLKINTEPWAGIPPRCLRVEKPRPRDTRQEGSTWCVAWRFSYRAGGWPDPPAAKPDPIEEV